MNKHTPGPWVVAATNSVFPKEAYDLGFTRGQRICQIRDRTETGSANARLIAAAPDLLEVVRDIVSDCEKGLNPGLYALAVAALAKAEGRE